MDLKRDAHIIIEAALEKVMPDEAVSQALTGKRFDRGRVYLVAAGKAAWQMSSHSGRQAAGRGMCDKVWACERTGSESSVL